MKILWLKWKDIKNPAAGGAELVGHELAKRLVSDGHEVIVVAAGFPNCSSEEFVDGYKVVRLGGRWTVYWQVYKYYKKFLRGWADLVIDEINTIPFFAKFYVKERNVVLIWQLCREIWFYQMFFPLNLIGYTLEPVYLWLLRESQAITESESTKRDLIRFGFKSDQIEVFNIGINLIPVSDLAEVKKNDDPTILYLGSLRAMKQPDQVIRAFEIAKQQIPDLKLKIAGMGEDYYAHLVRNQMAKSKFTDDIEYCGRVNNEQKTELMRHSHLICVTSVKEGWGLIVTEANSQGTPAVVYDVDGLRDSVRDGETGLISRENNPTNLAQNMIELLQNKEKYAKLQHNAWEWSKSFTFDNSYQQFKKLISF